MLKRRMIQVAVIALVVSIVAEAQADSTQRRHSIGTSLFTLFNFLPLDDPPEFLQLNYAYRFRSKHVISVEAITWSYGAPLGIAHWDEMTDVYPGTIKSYGLGLAYQHFFWKRAYAAVHALPLLQHYRDMEGSHIQAGFQLFMTARLGYHLRFGGERYFVEPSIAATTWPIHTNMPAAFREVESGWPSYFLLEPGLHAGVLF